ncbi:MAG: phosphatase PAP2 family protein [Bacteroidota bacterium]
MQNDPTRNSWLANWSDRYQYFLSRNRYYLGACCLLFILGIYYILSGQVGDVIVAINGQRNETRDQLFIFFTQFAEPIAYVSLIGIFALIRYRTAIFILACGAMAGVISAILKSVFGHARPLRYLYDNAIETWGLLQLFDEELYRNSWAYTSFPSGHAMSAFALYSFIAFNANRWRIPIASLCFFLASMVAFSRMYLLMHFLRDVVAGGIIGLMIGAFLFWAQFQVWPNNQKLDKGLLVKKE